MRKKLYWLLLILLVVFSCRKIEKKSVQKPLVFQYEEIYVDAPFVMSPIKIPIFPDTTLDIRDFGAKPDMDFNNSQFIADAIEACHQAGGGKVVIPPGKWFTGKIHLESHVNLHLQEGSELIFSDDPEDYLPAVQSSWEGMECFNYSPLIYAFNCENITLTGKGTLRPKMDNWEKWFARPPAHMNALVELYHMAAKGVPVEIRQMAQGENNFRPQLIQFNRCRNILIEDIKIRSSPFWTIHLLLSDQAVVRKVDVVAHGHNNDGIDPEMSSNILIEDCIFDQGDDVIAIKAGRNQDAWRLNKPSENIVIRNCVIKDGHQLLAIGSELSGGVRNVYLHDCTFPNKEKTQLTNLLFIKTNHRRGGFVENVYVENIEAGKIEGGVLGIETDVLYQWKDLVPTYEERITRIENIRLRDIRAKQANIAINIQGDAKFPVRKVHLKNIQVDNIVEKARHILNAEEIEEKTVNF